jgi:hypothetical protein
VKDSNYHGDTERRRITEGYREPRNGAVVNTFGLNMIVLAGIAIIVVAALVLVIVAVSQSNR